MAGTGRARIGTSGYQYDHWKEIFYAKGLPKRVWFRHYATQFNTVELNNTFYHLPKPETFAAWKQAAPADFCYALKLNRYGTHVKRLKDAESWLGKFLEGAERLEETLGPILVQLPPHWDKDCGRLREFFAVAPPTLRWAVEFRDPRWLCDATYEILAKHHAALCIHDMIPEHPRAITADWIYLRFHGTNYGENYPPERLRAEAKHIVLHLSEGKDVFAYFNNDREGYAIQNARDLRQYVELETGAPVRMEPA